MNVKKSLWIIPAALLCLSGFGTQAEAKTLLGDFLKEKNIEVELSAGMDFYNKYVWRGFLLDSDAVLQPSFTVSTMGFEGGFWGSFDLENKDALTSDEVDGWIGYSKSLEFLHEDLKMVTVSFGHTWYDFPESDLYSKEFYLGVALDTFLSPYFTWYHDYVDETNGGADGDFYHFGIGHSLTVCEEYGVTLDMGTELGLNDKAFIDGEGGFILLTAGLSIPLTESLTISPNIGFSSPFGDLDNQDDGTQGDEFYGGVAMAATF